MQIEILELIFADIQYYVYCIFHALAITIALHALAIMLYLYYKVRKNDREKS